MSFLNSILSSISGGSPAPPTAASTAQPPGARPAKPAQDKTFVTTGGATSGQAVKRKAENDLTPLASKALRKEGENTSDRTSTAPRAVATGTSATKQSSSSASPLPYRGTAKGNAPGAPNNSKLIPVKPTTAGSAASPTAAKPAQKPVTSTAATAPSAAAPKKGSYAEILARAKASQAKQVTVGTIKHKPVEKLSKQERIAQLVEAKKKQLPGKDIKSGLSSRSRSPESASARPGKPGEPSKKKALDLGYSGTMRPSSSVQTYKGTMNRASSSKAGQSAYDRSRSASLGAKPKDKARYAGYASYSEDDLEEEEGYDSDDLSDMEAGAYDLDQEEEFSLRAAKKEDEEALKQENELKRRKEERKRMLAKMAADAAKKKRY